LVTFKRKEVLAMTANRIDQCLWKRELSLAIDMQLRNIELPAAQPSPESFLEGNDSRNVRPDRKIRSDVRADTLSPANEARHVNCY